jgi:hypothetical protein|eukprot:COSAG02_NODE_5272_length_4480_cov_2.100205_5_plen_123_part_00
MSDIAAAAALADNLKPQVYPPGTVVMYQGDVAGAMYFISRCRLSYQKVSRHRSSCTSHSLGWPGLLSGCAEVWNQDKTQMYGVKNEGASVCPVSRTGGHCHSAHRRAAYRGWAAADWAGGYG